MKSNQDVTAGQCGYVTPQTPKKYWVRVDCAGFHDYIVTGAKSLEEAKDEAERAFQCDCTEGYASTDSRGALPGDEGEEIESMRHYRMKEDSNE